MFKKIKRYIAEVWGEVRPTDGKVSWPSKDEVMGSTWVVVATVAIFGLYLGLIDVVVGWAVKYALGIS